jgi:hypothetical protein
MVFLLKTEKETTSESSSPLKPVQDVQDVHAKALIFNEAILRTPRKALPSP